MTAALPVGSVQDFTHPPLRQVWWTKGHGRTTPKSVLFGSDALDARLARCRRRGTAYILLPELAARTTKIESTVRYLGIEVDDAIEIAEKIDI
jgi:hypothetical protein